MKKRLVITMLIATMVMSLGCGETAAQEAAEPATEEVVAETETPADGPEQTEAEPEAEPVEELQEPADEVTDGDAGDYEIWPDIDLASCDTFTQIVDTQLTDGMGYTNVTIGDEDVLLVTGQAYDNLDGNMAATSVIIYNYVGGVPTELMRVMAGGTAYPLAIKDGYLYQGGNHEMAKSTIVDGEFQNVALSWVEYDESGNATYFYMENGEGAKELKNDSKFNELFDEYNEAEVINFDVISK